MQGYFDSHAHYFDERFTREVPEGGVERLLASLFSSGAVSHIINVGTDIPTSRAAIRQAAAYPQMFAAAGVHPGDAMRYPDMEGELAALDALLRDRHTHKICALGEIGLDYHYEETDKKRQAEWFDAQLSLAERQDLPVIIHDREAHGDCFAAVCAHSGVRGVFHSYSGSLEMAQDLIRRGFYISFSGTVTFKNATKVAAVAAALPHDRVLIETDCPYLAPHPHRGELNHSGYLAYTAARLAELWGMETEEVIRVTAENAKILFGVK